MPTAIKLKKDKYRQARGGWSRLLEIYCSRCNHKFFLYQKDGPGPLKRLYKDRIFGSYNSNKIVCPQCQAIIGVSTIYKKENRPAFVLKEGTFKKKIKPINL